MPYNEERTLEVSETKGIKIVNNYSTLLVRRYIIIFGVAMMMCH